MDSRRVEEMAEEKREQDREADHIGQLMCYNGIMDEKTINLAGLLYRHLGSIR